MTEKTPQQEMSEKMSHMGRKRSGRLVQPTMSEMIEARKSKVEGISYQRDRGTGMRNSVASGDTDKVARTIRAKRKQQLGKLKPGKPKIMRRK